MKYKEILAIDMVKMYFPMVSQGYQQVIINKEPKNNERIHVFDREELKARNKWASFINI